MGSIRAHYVPQFYLKNFGSTIYFYDKQEQKRGSSTPRGICCEKNFYVKEGNGSAIWLEKEMGKLESSSGAAISEMIRTEDFVGLSDNNKMVLYAFVAFQHVRTKEYRSRRQVNAKILYDGVARGAGVTDWVIREKEECKEMFHLNSMENYMSLIPWIAQKGVCLLKNETGRPLWTSDNPVARYNSLSPRRGFGSPGVQITLPLTPKLLLFFYDKAAYGDLLQDTCPMEEANVIHNNHLQTIDSARFVFSNAPEFDMIERMVEKIERA